MQIGKETKEGKQYNPKRIKKGNGKTGGRISRDWKSISQIPERLYIKNTGKNADARKNLILVQHFCVM